MAEIIETWYTLSGTQAQPNLFKWWPYIDIWLFLCKGQLWFLILLYGKMLDYLETIEVDDNYKSY